MLLPFPARVRPVLAVPAGPLAPAGTRGSVPGALDQGVGALDRVSSALPLPCWEDLEKLLHFSVPMPPAAVDCFAGWKRQQQRFRSARACGDLCSEVLLICCGCGDVFSVRSVTWLSWENIYGGFIILCAAAGVFSCLDLFSSPGRLEYGKAHPVFGAGGWLWGMSIMSKVTKKTCGMGREAPSHDSQESLTLSDYFLHFLQRTRHRMINNCNIRVIFNLTPKLLLNKTTFYKT